MISVTAVCPTLNLTGHAYRHRTLGGIKGRLAEHAGQGWTWRVSGPKDELVALGAYEAEGGVWYLEIAKGSDPIEVRPS